MMVMVVLANATVVFILQGRNQINMLYSLSLHNVICQLYSSKAGENSANES